MGEKQKLDMEYFRSMSIGELKGLLFELRGAKMTTTAFYKAGGPPTTGGMGRNIFLLRNQKHNIARCLTAIREKELKG